MDELWQRFRGFWTPVLIGLGIFLLGLIVVHIVTDDPETLNRDVTSERDALKRKKEPKSSDLGNLKRNRTVLKERTEAWRPERPSTGSKATSGPQGRRWRTTNEFGRSD